VNTVLMALESCLNDYLHRLLKDDCEKPQLLLKAVNSDCTGKLWHYKLLWHPTVTEWKLDQFSAFAKPLRIQSSFPVTPKFTREANSILVQLWAPGVRNVQCTTFDLNNVVSGKKPKPLEALKISEINMPPNALQSYSSCAAGDFSVVIQTDWPADTEKTKIECNNGVISITFTRL